MLIDDIEIFADFMKTLALLGIENSILNHIYDEDGPYFAFTKAERYVLKITRNSNDLDNFRRS